MASLAREEGVAFIDKVALTHPDKELYPKIGLSKRDLAEFYASIGQRMLPFVRDRLLSLVRCPDGQGKFCFFQKHPGPGAPEGLKIAGVVEKNGEEGDYIYVDGVRGLIALVQIGTLEIHLWGSSLSDIEKPDRFVLDIDPDEELSFADVKKAAVDIRDRMQELGLETFPLVTGGKGVHVVAPLQRRREWGEVKAFARGLARTLAQAQPDRFVDTASKKQRRGRIFLDYLRNQRGATAISPYSTRAKPGAPVATPVSWAELASLDRANGFTLGAIVKRLRGKSDPWKGYFELRQSITKRAMDSVADDA